MILQKMPNSQTHGSRHLKLYLCNLVAISFKRLRKSLAHTHKKIFVLLSCSLKFTIGHPFCGYCANMFERNIPQKLEITFKKILHTTLRTYVTRVAFNKFFASLFRITLLQFSSITKHEQNCIHLAINILDILLYI